MNDVKEWTCPKCGQANTSRFCTGCGTKRPSDTWKCPNCGAENAGKFCTKCGQKRGDELGQTQPMQSLDASAAVRAPQQLPAQTPYEQPQMQQLSTKVPPAMQGRIAQQEPLGMVTAQQPDTSKGAKGKQIALIVVIIALLGALGFFGYREFFADSGTGYQPVAKQQAATDSKPVREMKTDLSLGGLDLGDDASAIAEVETDAEKKDPKQEGAMLRHYYDDMQIVEENGKSTALVSETDKVSTKRGIHQGSTLDEVQKAYGTDTFSQSDDGDGRMLYEYKFTGQDDRIGLVRFAVKDGKVDYISVRTYEGAAQPAGVKAASTAPAANDSESAKGTLRNFYSAISSKNLAAAWNLMTPEQQNRMGGYDSFRNGYSTTLSSAATNITVASSSADKVILNYTLIARDRAEGGHIKVQNFNGSATLVKQDGGWKISYTESSKVGERLQ